MCVVTLHSTHTNMIIWIDIIIDNVHLHFPPQPSLSRIALNLIGWFFHILKSGIDSKDKSTNSHSHVLTFLWNNENIKRLYGHMDDHPLHKLNLYILNFTHIIIMIKIINI